MFKENYNPINQNSANSANESTSAISLYLAYFFYNIVHLLTIGFFILLVVIIMLASLVIMKIVVEFLFKWPSDAALGCSLFLMFILSPIFSLLVLDKFIKKIFNYLSNQKKEKILKLKKTSKILYICLTILSYIFKNILFILFLILLSIILLPLSFLLFPILIKILKTPFLILRIIQQSSTNPSLIDYLYMTTQEKSIANFYEVNDELELILNSEELSNYIDSLEPTELTGEEIKEIGKFISLVKPLAKDPEKIDKIVSLIQNPSTDPPNNDGDILYDDDYIRIIYHKSKQEEEN